MAGDAPAPEEPGDEQPARDLGSFIREQRRQARLSMRKLAELAGVSNPYLSQIERGLRKPSADILQQLARALSISAESLYVRAGILEHPRHGVDVIGEILRDTSISVEQRQALVRVYRSFRVEAGSPLPADVDQPDPTGQESTGGPQR